MVNRVIIRTWAYILIKKKTHIRIQQAVNNFTFIAFYLPVLKSFQDTGIQIPPMLPACA